MGGWRPRGGRRGGNSAVAPEGAEGPVARNGPGAARWIHHVAEGAVLQPMHVAAAAVHDVAVHVADVHDADVHDAAQATGLRAGAIAAGRRWRRRWLRRRGRRGRRLRRLCRRIAACVGRPNEGIVVPTAGAATAIRQFRHRAQPPTLCVTLGRRFIRTQSRPAAGCRGPRPAAVDRISEWWPASPMIRRTADRAHHQPVCRALS